MEPFEYIVMLTSLILSLGIAQILNGIADMFANFKKVKFSYAHTVLTVVIFLVYIQDWFYTYFYAQQIQEWNLPTILYNMAFPIILFIESRFLFPTGSRVQETDMEAYFFENWRIIYSLFAVTIGLSIIANLTFSGYTLMDQIPLFIYLAVYLMYIILNVKDKMIHNVFVTLQLIAWIAFVFLDDTVLI